MPFLTTGKWVPDNGTYFYETIEVDGNVPIVRWMEDDKWVFVGWTPVPDWW